MIQIEANLTLTVQGDGVSTEFVIDLRNLAPFTGLKAGVLPDTLLGFGANVSSAVLSGHTLTVEFLAPFSGGSGVLFAFGFNGT